jgi:hypothetical protein
MKASGTYQVIAQDYLITVLLDTRFRLENTVLDANPKMRPGRCSLRVSPSRIHLEFFVASTLAQHLRSPPPEHLRSARRFALCSIA